MRRGIYQRRGYELQKTYRRPDEMWQPEEGQQPEMPASRVIRMPANRAIQKGKNCEPYTMNLPDSEPGVLMEPL
ncbi:hypothetical protein L2E82_27309 [Cichorium intybus]|uniref:Uncharacterized protein n=1 Tax=Cichorium intybus TaxID=13427 RepID=A0ACB9CSR0_CICIN|nr:hypothetical protein L2E82_27309 [Cichorium intybus]